MPWLVLVLTFAAWAAWLAITDPRRPLRRLLLGLAAIHVAAFVAWAASDSVDCHPGCSTSQDVLSYLVWLALPPVLLSAVLAALWAGRRSR